MRKHGFLINVVTSRAKGRLCDAILQHNNGPSAVDENRTTATKVVQRTIVEDVKLHRGDSAIEFRRQRLPLGQVTSTD
jgi:hypothetical protein